MHCLLASESLGKLTLLAMGSVQGHMACRFWVWGLSTQGLGKGIDRGDAAVHLSFSEALSSNARSDFGTCAVSRTIEA